MDAREIECATPDEGEWPKRDAVPVVAESVLEWDCVMVCSNPLLVGLLDANVRPAHGIPVTPESVRAANRFLQGDFAYQTEDLVRAVLGAQPVPLISDAELALTWERDRAVVDRNIMIDADPKQRMASLALHCIKQRDEALAERDEARATAKQHLRERDNLLQEATRYVEMLNETQEALAELQVSYNQVYDRLNSQLAARPAPVPDTPSPTSDFTRDFSGDRRRMGV